MQSYNRPIQFKYIGTTYTLLQYLKKEPFCIYDPTFPFRFIFKKKIIRYKKEEETIIKRWGKEIENLTYKSPTYSILKKSLICGGESLDSSFCPKRPSNMAVLCSQYNTPFFSAPFFPYTGARLISITL